LALETTLVGVLQVDPKKLLEEGIRKILVTKIHLSLERTLVWETKSLAEFYQKLLMLQKILEGTLRLFCLFFCESKESEIRSERICWCFMFSLAFLTIRIQAVVHVHPGLRQHVWPQDLAGRVPAHHFLLRREGVQQVHEAGRDREVAVPVQDHPDP
jgi:hypothetical protein